MMVLKSIYEKPESELLSLESECNFLLSTKGSEQFSTTSGGWDDDSEEEIEG